MSEDIALQNDSKIDVKEILKVWRNELGLDTYKQLAELLGVTQNTIESWKIRGKIPDKIYYQYELIKTKRDLLKQKNISSPFVLPFASPIVASACTIPRFKFFDIESIKIKVINLYESLTFSKNIFGDYKNLQAYKVEDNLMSPKFLKDDLVFFDKKEFGKNGFYILDVNGNIMLRQVIFKTKKLINVKTLDGIEDYEIELSDEIKLLGRVVKAINSF